MEQILITRASGVVELINKTETLTVITSAEHRKALLGEDVVVMVVESAVDRGFGVGDSIKLFGGNTYRINQLPKVTKLSQRQFQYELVFEGIQYDLLRVSYRNEDVSNFNTSADFVLVGDIEMYLNVLINNANRVFGANKWVLGTFPTVTDTKNLQFNNDNCLSVLQRICTEFDYQFIFTETTTQKILHIKKVGAELDFNFQYGKAKGLYQLSREKVESKNIVNKLFVYGSTKNIPSNYKNYSERLRLGDAEDETVLVASDSLSAFGVFESTQIFEEVFPKRLGNISSINTSNRYEFTDSSMDFDLNEIDENGNTKWLIEGNSAKIHFNTGNLAGYEFEVSKYVHATKTFTINPIIDPKGLNLPSITESAFFISVSDKYVLLDIVMPDPYIATAEAELETKATAYLQQNKIPQVQYGLDIDEVFLQSKTSNLNIFELCDTVNIEDNDLGINSRIKIIAFTRDVLLPFKYKLTISDVADTSVLRGLINDTTNIKKVIERKGIADPTKNKSDPNITSQVVSVTKGVLKNKDGLELGNRENDSLTKILGRLGIGYNNVFYENNVTDANGVIRYGLGLDTWELMIEGNIETAGKISVGQGQILLSKEVLPNDTAYGVIGGTTYIDVTTPQFNVQNILGVKEIQSIDANPINANGAWVFSQPLTIVNGTEPNQAITKQFFETTMSYVVAGGFKWYGNITLAATTNVTRYGGQTIDGVYAGFVGDIGQKVLLMFQSNKAENGLYMVQAGDWVRLDDYNSTDEIFNAVISITNGETNQGSQFICRTTPITIGTTELIYEVYSKNYINPYIAHTNDLGTPQVFYGENIFSGLITVPAPTAGGSPATKLYVDTIKATIDNTIANLGNQVTGGYWQKIGTSGFGTTANDPIFFYANNVKKAELNAGGGLTGLSQIIVNSGMYNDPFASSGLGGYYQGIMKGNFHIGALSGTTKNLYSVDLVRANSSGKRSGVRFGNYNSMAFNQFYRGIEFDGSNIKIGTYTNTGMDSEASSNAPVLDYTKIITIDIDGKTGFGNETPAERIDLTGSLKYSETLKPLGVAPSESGMVLKSLITGSTITNLWQNITIADIKSIGADHTFIKSNGGSLEWSPMTVGEITDISTTYLSIADANAKFVKYESLTNSERGIAFYSDTDNQVFEAQITTGEDAGIALGIYGNKMIDNDTANIKQFGLQLNRNDGKLYHYTLDGLQKRILTEEDSLTGGGGNNTWNGGSVTNDIHLALLKKMTFGYISNQVNGKIETVQNNTLVDFRIVASDMMTLAAEGFAGVIDIKGTTIKINGIVLDMAKVASLIGV